MFCRTCGDKTKSLEQGCARCGNHPLKGREYCQDCGARVFLGDTACGQCGATLKSLHVRQVQMNEVDRPLPTCRQCGCTLYNVSSVHPQYDLICNPCFEKNKDNMSYWDKTGNSSYPRRKYTNDQPEPLANFATFCCSPIVGIVLYLVWKDEKPIAADSVCKWTIAGVIVSIAMYIFAMFLGLLTSLST